MNKSRARATLFIYPFKIDHQRARVVLRKRHNLRAKEGHDMVRDHLATLGLEVRVVDAEAIVEPVYFAFDEIAGYKALRE